MEKAAVREEENVGSIDRMLFAQLGPFSLGHLLGIQVGTRVPIILTSRADTVLARMASCAVALVAARRGYGGAVTQAAPRVCRSVGVVG